MAFRDEATHRHRPPGSGAPPGVDGRQRCDLTPSDRLLHGEEKQVWADAGYHGIGKRAERAHRGVSWQIAMNPGSVAAKVETAKARVEHPFRIASGCSAATWFAIEVWRGTCSGLRSFWASRT